MSLKFPIAAMVVSLIAVGCSQEHNPLPMSPATPNATDTPTPPRSSTSPDGTLNSAPSATTPPAQRATPDSPR